MKTAGDLIKETRLKNALTQEELGEMTHIRTSFIKAIEKSDWDSLPELAVVIGFVKSISHFLDVDETQTVALLKREYKPVTKIKPTTPVKIRKKFIWGPRMTFFSLILVALLIVIGYLAFQYSKFNLPPKLVVNEPTEQMLVKESPLMVSGTTDPDATVEVNNQPVFVTNSGNFNTQIDVSDNTSEIKVVAKSRSGKESTISRKIEVKL